MSRWPRLVAALLVLGALSLQSIGAWQDSQTTDEAVHLAAGLSYWQTGDWRLNPEHPPVFKLLAAVPLLLSTSARLNTNDEVWRQGNEWLVGAKFLYDSPGQAKYGTRWLMFLGRWPMIGLWLLLVLTLYGLSRERWGEWPAVAVAAVAAYDPNLLGHGHLVTNDIGLAWLFLLVCWRTDRFMRRPSWRELLFLVSFFAIAQNMKFSAVILWLIVPFVTLLGLVEPRQSPPEVGHRLRWWQELSAQLLYRVGRNPRIRPDRASASGLVRGIKPNSLFSWSWWRRLVIGLVVGASFVTWMVYGFGVQRIDRDPRVSQLWQERQTILDQGTIDEQPPFVRSLIGWSDPGTAGGRWLMNFSHWTVPGYWYWRGLSSASTHNYFGHAAYLLGQTSERGWWYYFPVALWVKTPFPLLAAGLTWIAWQAYTLFRRWRNRQLNWVEVWSAGGWTLVFPPLFFLLWSMTSHINIGLRHIFPTYVFLPLTVGSLVAAAQRWRPRPARWAIVGAVIIPIMVAVAAWPNTIGYFNSFGGGTTGGYRFVLDSNLDWNQDIWRLRSWLNQRRLPRVHLVLFGSIPADKVFPERLPVLTDDQIASGERPRDIVVISAGQLYNEDGPFHWLRAYRPTWRIGSSITAYDFRALDNN